jgi:catechol 2,3-dioxygenase-like lactoylglutathione lyase family enzyme
LFNSDSVKESFFMRITRLTLPSTDADACLAFYRDVLQLPTIGTSVHVGWTQVDIVPTAVDTGCVHLAFNIPYGRFDAARTWLCERALLLRDPLGEDRFHIGGAWDAESVYFAGPHDSVLELIARRPLDTGVAATGSFRSSEIACVSEVGLPTDDVPGLVREIVVSTGLAPFGSLSDGFAPMGGHEGLLVVVDRSRPWVPEGRHLPGARDLRVVMEGVLPGASLSDEEGWQVVSEGPEWEAPRKAGRASIPVW